MNLRNYVGSGVQDGAAADESVGRGSASGVDRRYAGQSRYPYRQDNRATDLEREASFDAGSIGGRRAELSDRGKVFGAYLARREFGFFADSSQSLGDFGCPDFPKSGITCDMAIRGHGGPTDGASRPQIEGP